MVDSDDVVGAAEVQSVRSRRIQAAWPPTSRVTRRPPTSGPA